MTPEAEEVIEEMQEYLAHGMWRCDYRTRYGRCMCGLDALCKRFGIPPIPPNDPEAPRAAKS